MTSPSGILSSTRKLRVGVVGAGFGSSFFFHEHPNCIVEAVSGHHPRDRELLMKTYGCAKSYDSLDLLIRDPKIEAVAIFTPAPDHARHAIAVLQAGKHVLCAVPAAMTLEECAELKDAVKQSGLTYMMAETSVYRQDTISAKQFYEEGRFGRIFAAEAEYHHPGLENYFFTADKKPTWRHGFPPMNYTTHCTAFLLAVTRERLTRVSCIGWGDDSPLLQNNPYRNPFWNETALFKSNRDTAFRVSVCWKGALMPIERGEWYGEKMSFFAKNPLGLDEMLVHATEKLGRDDGGFENQEPALEHYTSPLWWQTGRLPQPLRHPSGHGDSHTFITHEFVDAIINERRPEIDIDQALAFTAPGIVAHHSALKGGESLPIPNFDA